jgi:flagellar biosynthesis/type III secretory pathway protein FliH
MIQFFLIALLVFALAAAAAAFAAIAQGKRAKKAEAETRTLREAFGQVKEKAERLRAALDKTAQTEGEANAERKELAQALDSELVARANNLFK